MENLGIYGVIIIVIIAILIIGFGIQHKILKKKRFLAGDEQNSTFVLPVGLLMVFAVLLGLLLITFKPLIDGGFFPELPIFSGKFGDLLKSISESLGQAVFVAGLVGVLFEIASVKRYFEQRISDILINDEYLKNQKNGELMRLRQRATMNIYAKKSKKVDPELLELDKNICDALTRPYFDFFHQSSVCELSEDKKFITKTVKTRFKLINPQIKNANFLEIYQRKTRLASISGLENNALRVLNTFHVSVDGNDSESITDKFQIVVSENDTPNQQMGYDVKTSLEFSATSNMEKSSLSFSDSFEAVIVETRIIPSNDLNYSFRINTLVRNFKFNLVFEKEGIQLGGNLYGTMSNPREGIFIDRDSNSISIESRKWMLKGNGVYVSIIPKNWSLQN